MDKPQIWSTIHAERQALADDLEKVKDSDWKQPSLCEGWSVRDVLAHMTGTARMTPGKFFPTLITSGFKMSKLQQKDIDHINQGDTLAAFKGEVRSTKAPPGPTLTWLGETIVHADDIRRPLGIKHDYPAEAMTAVADSYKGSNLVIGAKKRIAGVKLVATDTGWTHGDGPEVKGPMMALVMTMAGRKAALSDLSGDGLATLEARF
jgi:uncharacterized protein (TIGR03083 family)